MITLAEIGAMLRALIGPLYTILNGVLSGLSTLATSQQLDQIQVDVTAIGTEISDPTNGLLAIKTQLDAIQLDLLTDYTNLLTAIGTPQQAAIAVTLPTTPPAGYGGTLDPADVWLYPIGSQGYNAADYCGAAGHVALNVGRAAAIQVAFAGPFVLESSIDNPNERVAENGPPVIAPTTILPTDTLLTWLQREWDITPPWSFHAPSQTYYYQDDPANNAAIWRCTLSEAQFAALKSGGVVPAVLANVPPVWPGLELVTLGSTSALAPQMAIAEPCDGVIIVLDAVSANKTFFPYGGVNGYRGIGALSFFDDNGEQETYQPLMFTDQVYCCLAMSHAAGVRLRVDPSVSGTIQLWSITPT